MDTDGQRWIDLGVDVWMDMSEWMDVYIGLVWQKAASDRAAEEPAAKAKPAQQRQCFYTDLTLLSSHLPGAKTKQQFDPPLSSVM